MKNPLISYVTFVVCFECKKTKDVKVYVKLIKKKYNMNVLKFNLDRS